MSTKKVTGQMIADLFALIAEIGSAEDMQDLFADLCTNKEIEQMAQRLASAKMLMNGMTYQDVIGQTDISSATLSRVSRCVQYGKGYSRFLSGKEKA